MVPVRLNRTLIEERRVAAGLTLQQLADRVGITRGFLRSSIHDDGVSIGVAVRLSETLDIPLAELLSDEPVEPIQVSDEVRAAAALADKPSLTRAQLAGLFGWTLTQASAALRRVERRLQGTGLRLRRCGPQTFRIEADLRVLNQEERFRLRHLGIEDQGLPAHVAAVLLSIVRGYGTRRWMEDNVAPDDNCIEFLRRAGLVFTHHQIIEILPAVGYSLGLEGWDSPDVSPQPDPLASLFRRL